MQTKRLEYLAACGDERPLSEIDRRPMLEEFLDHLEDNPDLARAWNLTKSFSGSTHSTAFCDPLLHNGRAFLTNTGKANGFVQQYAAVNRLSFDKTERSQARHLKKALQLLTTLLPLLGPMARAELCVVTIMSVQPGGLPQAKLQRGPNSQNHATISDGFQVAKPQRSLMALLDFSKAFDRAWREGLLHVVSAKGLPIPFSRWLSNFLSNRPARVQPKFLRVTLNRLFTFGPHIQNISTKAAARCRLLASLNSKEWAWRKDHLKIKKLCSSAS